MSFVKKDLGGGLGEEMFTPATPAQRAAMKHAKVIKAAMDRITVALIKNRDEIAKLFVTRGVIRRVDKHSGATIDYVVRIGKREAGFLSRADAEGFALELFKARNPDLYRLDDDKSQGRGGLTGAIEQELRSQAALSESDAAVQSHLNAGTSPLGPDDGSHDADPTLQRERARARIAQAQKNVRLR